MRFSLKDLLAIVAFCAAIFWCASQVGFDNGVFWFGLALSAILSTLFVMFARKGRYGLAISDGQFLRRCGIHASLGFNIGNAILFDLGSIVLWLRKQPTDVRDSELCCRRCRTVGDRGVHRVRRRRLSPDDGDAAGVSRCLARKDGWLMKAARGPQAAPLQNDECFAVRAARRFRNQSHLHRLPPLAISPFAQPRLRSVCSLPWFRRQSDGAD